MLIETPPSRFDFFPVSGNWTKEQLKLAFYLYCQTPFGKLYSRNPEIIELAGQIGRTPSALAMKLVNFASLDPTITGSGRIGLRSASKLDREVWDEFNSDWDRLVVECGMLRREVSNQLAKEEKSPLASDLDLAAEDFTGETRNAIVEQRMKQDFFRKTVLSSYGNRCCMSGASDTRLLVASHIVPWSRDKANRLNPRNGLCLSAIHDKAFDVGIITLSDDLRIILSAELFARQDDFIRKVFLPIKNKRIEIPDRFAHRFRTLEMKKEAFY